MTSSAAPGRNPAVNGPIAIIPGILIPGFAAWARGQRERGAVLLTTSVSAWSVGLFFWGTTISLVALAYGFLVHAASTAETIGARSFPGFGLKVRWTFAAGVVGFSFYLPALALGSVYAWPCFRSDASGEGYLVDRAGAQGHLPEIGQWVWFETADGRGRRVARVLARPGEWVEWAGGRMRLGSRSAPRSESSGHGTAFWDIREQSMRIPDAHILVQPEEQVIDTISGTYPSEGAVLVAQDQILGIAWARMYPIRRRNQL